MSDRKRPREMVEAELKTLVEQIASDMERAAMVVVAAIDMADAWRTYAVAVKAMRAWSVGHGLLRDELLDHRSAADVVLSASALSSEAHKSFEGSSLDGFCETMRLMVRPLPPSPSELAEFCEALKAKAETQNKENLEPKLAA